MTEFIHARTCHICEANCGVLMTVKDGEVTSVKGNPDHVLSEGYICPKATAIPDIQNDPDRLRKPVKKVGDKWQEISWETAFTEIAKKLESVKAGPKCPLFISAIPTPIITPRIFICAAFSRHGAAGAFTRRRPLIKSRI